jgi:hypothetical protein
MFYFSHYNPYLPRFYTQSPCLTSFLSLFIPAEIIAHAVLDVVVDDEVQFFVSEAIVPRQRSC